MVGYGLYGISEQVPKLMLAVVSERGDIIDGAGGFDPMWIPTIFVPLHQILSAISQLGMGVSQGHITPRSAPLLRTPSEHLWDGDFGDFDIKKRH
jgi:hypothetical protein